MTLICNGRVIDPASGLDQVTDVLLREGRIAKLGENLERDGCDRVIDAAGWVVAPGLVDGHVHFRDPGFPCKEDITTGAASAAAGGFTTVVCMANTKPPVDRAEGLTELRQRAETLPIHVLNTSTLTLGMEGKELADLEGLKAAGAVAFTDDGRAVQDAALLKRAMERSRELGVPIALHEEDPALLESSGVHQGRISEKLGVAGASALAEEVLVARDCLLALRTGAAIVIQHVSSAVSVELLRTMKALGAKVYGEVTPHHFSLNEEILLEKGTLAKVNPPIRTEEDRLALIRGLQDGVIDGIVTDHAPHTREEKARGWAEAPSGMIGLETALALGITNLVRPGYLSLSQLVEKMTVAPARFYGLEAGRLLAGAPADLVLFDPEERWRVGDTFWSRSSNSPFIGMELFGRVKGTICGGKAVYTDGKGRA